MRFTDNPTKFRGILYRAASIGAIWLFAIAIPIYSLTGCLTTTLLTEVTIHPQTISPNGDEINDTATLRIPVGRRANVTVILLDSKGTEIMLRDRVTRAPDDYELAFNGAVRVGDTGNSRVLPDGEYAFRVIVEDVDGGERVEKEASFTIANADTMPVEISNLATSLTTISPNGDAIDDEVRVSYGLNKLSTTQVYALSDSGRRYLIEPPLEKNATLQSHIWNGAAGDKVVPDGDYQFVVEAWDTAGNFSVAFAPIRIENGGVSRLEIVDAKFSPVAVASGGTLNVRITVKNTGETRLNTMGPPPDTAYTTEMNFATFRDPDNPNIALYFERPGVWRVGIGWTNAPQNLPVRWGLFDDLDRELLPGEEVTITGQIEVMESSTRELTFYASVVQEGVGFPGGQVGHTRVKVSF